MEENNNHSHLADFHKLGGWGVVGMKKKQLEKVGIAAWYTHENMHPLRAKSQQFWQSV